MKPEQKFDSIIKKKVDEAEFPFDEQNWNKLSMQLDAERRLATNRGWGKFLFLGLLFLGVTSASIALYKIQGPLGFKDQLAGNTSSNDNNGSSAQAHGANGNNNSGNNSENNLLASNNNNSTIGLANYDANNANTTLGIINNSANVGNDNSSTNNISGANNNSSNELSDKNNSASVKGKKESNYSSTSKGGLNKNAFKGSLEEDNLKSGDANDMNAGARTKRILDGDVLLEHNALNRIDSKLNIVYSNRNVKLGVLKIPSWYDEDYHRKGKKRLSFLNAEAGGAFLLGWDSKEGKDGRGLNWYAGVNYGKFFKKNVGFSAGLQFYNIGNIKQSFYESSKSVYGLGSTSSNTIITTKSLFYFSVPVKLYYAVSPSHQLGVSVNPSFLFSSKNVVENYRLTDDIKSNEIITKSSGIYEGVRLNNVLISAFYKAQLSKRLFLNTEVLYGVRDIFKNTSSNNYSQKPLGLRVGLQYTLFEK